MATFTYPGPHCKRVGILCDMPLSLCELTKAALTKCVIFFCKENGISWESFRQWNERYIPNVSLSCLDKKRVKDNTQNSYKLYKKAT